MPLLKKSKKLKQYLPALLFVFVATLMVILLVIPTVSDTIKNKDTIAIQTDHVNKLKAKAASLESIDLSSQEDQLETALTSLPLTPTFQQSLSLIVDLIDEHQLSVTELSFTNSQDAIVVNLSTFSTMPLLQSFMDDIYQSAPVSSIDKASISFIKELEDNSDQYTADISIIVNSQPGPESIGKPSDPLPVVDASQKETLQTLVKLFKPTEQSQPSNFETATDLFPTQN